VKKSAEIGIDALRILIIFNRGCSMEPVSNLPNPRARRRSEEKSRKKGKVKKQFLRSNRIAFSDSEKARPRNLERRIGND